MLSPTSCRDVYVFKIYNQHFPRVNPIFKIEELHIPQQEKRNVKAFATCATGPYPTGLPHPKRKTYFILFYFYHFSYFDDVVSGKSKMSRKMGNRRRYKESRKFCMFIYMCILSSTSVSSHMSSSVPVPSMYVAPQLLLSLYSCSNAC